MKKENIFKNKRYTHLDIKKNYKKYKKLIKNPNWIKSHGFYPFLHSTITYNKYVYNKNTGLKEPEEKNRQICSSAHIDRFIYQYYGHITNEAYNTIAVERGINKIATAYRNNLKGKCNIHFAKEALEFIVKSRNAFIFIGDFSDFFNNLDHQYLKEKLQQTLNVKRLTNDHYAVFKNITKYTYIEYKDIEEYTGKLRKQMENKIKFFDSKEFREFKKKDNILHTNNNNYGIPQGSSISSVYSNVYMMDFDKQINDYVTSKKGLYRRYCDDIIVVIPTTESEVECNKHLEYIEKIYSIKNNIPRLDLNLDKTEQFFYNKQLNNKLINLKHGKNMLNYLGFSFDGDFVRIRDKSLFKYYSRAYRKIKTIKRYQSENDGRNIKRHKGKIDEHTLKKSLYKLYTHLGDLKYSKGYGNFITYARRSAKIFDQSKYLENKIHNQIKRHWKKINCRLKE